MQLVEDYLNTFSGLKKWLEKTKESAFKQGYVETMLGRRRRLPDLYSVVPALRSNAERQAINAPIQGTGTDMTLRSMVEIQAYIEKHKLKSKMICTVHDSIVFDVYIPELAELAYNVKYIMEHVHKPYIDTDVPIVSEFEVGDTYGSVFDADMPDIQKIITVSEFNDWLHTQKVAKYTKEIKHFATNNYSRQDMLSYLVANDRPIKELKKVIKEYY